MALKDEIDEPIYVEIPPNTQDGSPSRLRGVNLLADPRKIADDELVLAKNCFPTLFGVPAKRQTLAAVEQLLAVGPPGANVRVPIFAFPPIYESSIDVIWVTRNVAGSQNTTLWSINNGSGAVVLDVDVGLVTQFTPSIANLGYKTYVTLGRPFTNHVGYLLSATSPSAVPTLVPFDFQGTGNVLTDQNPQAFSPRVVAPYGDRLVYANFGPGYENYVVFSDSLHNGAVANPQTSVGNSVLAANGRNIIIGGARDGDQIVAMIEITPTSIGTPPQRALLILKEYSAYIITGEPSQTTDTSSSAPPNNVALGNMQVSRINYNCGCSSAATVCPTPYGVLWAAWDDVWFFPNGQVPVRVGTKIRPALMRTPAGLRYRWHAAYFNGVYRLAIDSAGAGITDDAPCGEQWWLDLRNSPTQNTIGDEEQQDNAEWWGPQQFLVARNNLSGGVGTQQGTRTMYVEDRPSRTKVLYGVETSQNNGQGGDGTYICQYDTPGIRDVTYIPASGGPGSTAYLNNVSFNGTEVALDVRSKEYDLGDSRADKMVQGIEFNAWTDIDVVLNGDIVMDGGAVTDTQSKQLSQFGFALNVDPLDGTVPMSRQTQGGRISANPNTRDIGKTFQVRVYDTPGYYVTLGDNDTFVWTFASGGAYYVSKVPAGYYANESAFCAAMIAAMVAGGVFTCNQVPVPTAVLTSFTTASSWNPVFQTSDLVGHLPGVGQPVAVTAAQLRMSRKIWALLGYDTTVAGSSLAGTTVAGYTSAPTVTAAQLELASLAIDVIVFPRRPT